LHQPSPWPYTRKEYAGGAPLLCSDPSAVPLAGEGICGFNADFP
jgi:hypothetical protein